MLIDYYFRPLTLHDLACMMEIEREVFTSPWSVGQMKDSLLAAHCQAWGIYSDLTGDLIGFGILSVIFEEVEILTFSIAKKFQRRGYGGNLLKFLLEKSKEAKAEKIFLEVPKSNFQAIALYQKFNFRIMGERENYYVSPDNTREDAILMRCDL